MARTLFTRVNRACSLPHFWAQMFEMLPNPPGAHETQDLLNL